MTQIVTGSPKLRTDFRTQVETVRFKNPSTGEYLHLSGSGVTSGTAYAWIGSKRQARTLRQRASDRGEVWPFKAVSSKEVSSE